MAEALVCWKCGASLATLLLPFGRAEVCLACNADVRVCRMCVFFDPAQHIHLQLALCVLRTVDLATYPL